MGEVMGPEGQIGWAPAIHLFDLTPTPAN